MPTVFIIFGYIFKYYSNDHEPIHVHVFKRNATAKYTISPVNLVENHGFKPAELRLIESLIEENKEIIAEHWNKYFNKTE